MAVILDCKTGFRPSSKYFKLCCQTPPKKLFYFSYFYLFVYFVPFPGKFHFSLLTKYEVLIRFCRFCICTKHNQSVRFWDQIKIVTPASNRMNHCSNCCWIWTVFLAWNANYPVDLHTNPHKGCEMIFDFWKICC